MSSHQIKMILQTILLIFILLFLVGIFIFTIIFLVSIFETIFEVKVPFVPVPNAVLAPIANTLEVKKGSAVYDLGCGDARVLCHMAKQNPDAEFIGVERVMFPYMLALLRVKLSGVKNMKIVRKNFFNMNFSDASHIFVYLFPEIMNQLLPKLNAELPKGARVVSASFVFSNKTPAKVVDLNRKKNNLVRELFVYEF